MVQKGAIKLQYVSNNEQVVDVLTKPLSRVKFELLHDKTGVVQKVLARRNGDGTTNDEDMDLLRKGGTS